MWGTYQKNAKKGDKYQPTGSTKTPRLIQSLTDKVIIDIAAGSGHDLAISEDYEVYAWGSGMEGQLGFDVENVGNYEGAARVHMEPKVKFISAGVAHSCAITMENRLMVWGTNRTGQLGYPKKLSNVLRPVINGGFLDVQMCCPEMAIKFGNKPTVQDF